MRAPLPGGLPTAPFDVDPATAPYWDAASRGQLVLPWCTSCDAAFWYPRGFCPRCGDEGIQWRASAGRGRLYSWTIVHRAGGVWAAHVPFCVAVVQLDDGVSVTANIIGADPAELSLDARVVAVFERGDDGDLPALRFAPDHSPDRKE